MMTVVLGVDELFLVVTAVVFELLLRVVPPAEVATCPEQDVQATTRPVEVGGPLQLVAVLVQHHTEDDDTDCCGETCTQPTEEVKVCFNLAIIIKANGGELIFSFIISITINK